MKDGLLRAGLYARVSSEQQAAAQTIESQVDALRRRIGSDGLPLEEDCCFVDNGYSGSTLVRPALERLRDLAAAGGLDRLYVHAPDRLSRQQAYLVLLVDEMRRCGVELVFLNHPIGETPEDQLLLQVQGVVAEYERAKIIERNRRGKRFSARRGNVSALGQAPYGYHYVSRQEGGGEARYQVLFEEARVVRDIFEWVVTERISLREACRRLARQGVISPSGQARWNAPTLHRILTNPVYKGSAVYGRTRWVPRERTIRLRPAHGHPEHPRRAAAPQAVPREEWIHIPVPAMVNADLFDAAAEQLEENRRRHRRRPHGHVMLAGLLVCARCGYACCGSHAGNRIYYRCTGSHPETGHPACPNRPSLRGDLLETAVWDDVRSLLSEPERIEREYQRRLEQLVPGAESESTLTTATIQHLEGCIRRLIDAYQGGWLKQAEFESRIPVLRGRLERLRHEAQAETDRITQLRQLRCVMGEMQTFTGQMQERLELTDDAQKQQIIRALVKRIEVADDDIRIVYRVTPRPFESRPQRGGLQYCQLHLRATSCNSKLVDRSG